MVKLSSGNDRSDRRVVDRPARAGDQTVNVAHLRYMCHARAIVSRCVKFAGQIQHLSTQLVGALDTLDEVRWGDAAARQRFGPLQEADWTDLEARDISVDVLVIHEERFVQRVERLDHVGDRAGDEPGDQVRLAPLR